MTRTALVLLALVFLVCFSRVQANPEVPAKTSPPEKIATTKIADEEFLLTDKTEIKLDGKRIRYADVPDHSVIIFVELAADDKTMLKLHFRSKKTTVKK